MVFIFEIIDNRYWKLMLLPISLCALTNITNNSQKKIFLFISRTENSLETIHDIRSNKFFAECFDKSADVWKIHRTIKNNDQHTSNLLGWHLTMDENHFLIALYQNAKWGVKSFIMSINMQVSIIVVK